MHRICTHILRSPLLTTLSVGALAILSFFLMPQFAFASDLDTAFGNANVEGGSTIMWFLYKMIVGLTGWIASMGADALTGSVRWFVTGFGDFYNNKGIGVALEGIWTIIRDLFNFALIFGLIYIGFKMIIDANDSRAKRTLASLIVAALLVNFSLFIVKLIIEVTNLLSAYIVYDLLGTDILNPDDSLINPFLQAIGFSNMFNASLLESMSGAAFAYIFLVGIFLIVLAIVCFAGAFLMLVRFVSLCVYIVFSPLMFLGWVFPSMAGYSNTFMRGLLGKAFTAPAYLFMLYISIQVLIQVANNIGGNMINIVPSAENRNPASADFSGVLITYLVAMGFLIGSVIIAQKLGADGANASMKVINNIGSRGRRFAQQSAGNLTAGVAGRAGRSTIGVGANMYTSSRLGKSLAARSSFGKAAFKVAERGASSSFDVRQVGGVGKAMGVGEGKKGGVAKIVKDRKKADEEFAKAIHQDVNFENDTAKAAERDARVAEIKSTAQNEQAKLRAENEKLERDKQLRAKDSSTLSTELAENQTNLDTAKNNYQNALTSGSRTGKELADLQAVVEAEQQLVDAQEAALAFAKEREKLTAEAAKQRAIADTTNDPGERKSAMEKAEAVELQLSQQQAQFDNEINTTIQANNLKRLALQKDIDSAVKKAEAEIVYANEIAYMKQLESSQRFWNKVGTGFGAIAVSSAGSPAAGALAAGSYSNAYYSNAGLEALKKEYGEDGLKKYKSAADEKAAKQLAKAIKEQAGESGTSTEPKSDSSENS